MSAPRGAPVTLPTVSSSTHSTEAVLSSARVRQPVMDDLGELALCLIGLLERLLELLPAEGEQLDLPDGADGGPSSRFREDPDLAEELAGAEGRELDLFALGDDRDAVGIPHLLSPLGERVECRAGEIGKHLREPVVVARERGLARR